MMIRALEIRPSSITAASTRQTIRRPEPLFFFFISKGTSRFYTFRNFRMDSKLPNTPTRKPVIA